MTTFVFQHHSYIISNSNLLTSKPNKLTHNGLSSKAFAGAVGSLYATIVTPSLSPPGSLEPSLIPSTSPSV